MYPENSYQSQEVKITIILLTKLQTSLEDHMLFKMSFFLFSRNKSRILHCIVFLCLFSLPPIWYNSPVLSCHSWPWYFWWEMSSYPKDDTLICIYLIISSDYVVFFFAFLIRIPQRWHCVLLGASCQGLYDATISYYHSC